MACVPKGSSADHIQLALSGSQVFPFISDKLSAKSQLCDGRWRGMSGGEANTPDVFQEDGRTLFFGTNAFHHPLRVQMLNLGTFPGSFSRKKPLPYFPQGNKISCVFKTLRTQSSLGMFLFCIWIKFGEWGRILNFTGCVCSSPKDPVGYLLWKTGKMLIIRRSIY